MYQIVRNYGKLCNALEFDEKAFAIASIDMDTFDEWDVLAKADEISTRLQLDGLKDQTLSKLSSGERKRVAIGAALTQKPDALLLDEPTNNLDSKAIRLLLDAIADEREMTVLCIAHDRSFLNEICDRIIELDEGSIYGHEGDYADYLEGDAGKISEC